MIVVIATQSRLAKNRGKFEGVWVILYMGYIALCGPKAYVFLVVLVINWVWFCILVLNSVCFLESATFSALSIRLLTNALQNALNNGLN